ncbi:MAG: hypothetical protein ACI4VN_01735 [Clostridia bacterium]|nr:hypothetical protein [Clostridia bacterium]
MGNNKEKDVDKILGMNRTMFFVIVILLCILSLSIGIYAQVFYRYSDTDPFMLGIGVGSTQDAAEITKLKNEFNNNSIFTNDVSGQTSVKDIKKKKSEKDIVWTYNTTTEKEEDKYNISASVPQININSIEAEKINAQIEADYIDKIEEIMNKSEEQTDYSVVYKAYLNGDLLSLIIKETIHEGQTTQSAKIKTYNYNLNNDTQVSINEIIKAKKYEAKDLQKEINAEIEELNKKDEDLKSQYSEMKLRDLNNSIYKIENTENFIVDQNGYLYIIYAYGNTENTNKIDVIIFE